MRNISSKFNNVFFKEIALTILVVSFFISTTNVVAASVFATENIATGSITSSDPKMAMFTPKSVGGELAFQTTIAPDSVTYFFSDNVHLRSFEVIKHNTKASILFYNGSTSWYCDPCKGVTTTLSTNGITSINLKSVKINNYETPITTVILNGGLRGAVANGYLFSSQLPQGTSSTVQLSGVNKPILYTSSYRYPDKTLNVSLHIPTGDIVVLHKPSGLYGVSFRPTATKVIFSASTTASVLTETANRYTVKFNNLKLVNVNKGSITLNNTIVVAKVTGLLTVSGESNFKPNTGSVNAHNDILDYYFTAPSLPGSPIEPDLTINMKKGAVERFIFGSNSFVSYYCSKLGFPPYEPKCSGSVTLSADKRSLTFKNFIAMSALGRKIIFNGVVVTGAGL